MKMEISVNEMLNDTITKVNYTLVPQGFQGDVRAVRCMQDSLTRLIDWIGEQSASAQGLNRVITTADKLRNSPTHTLYLLKDPSARNGLGEVIGMLKVGQKHLFLFDEREQVHELEPLCVLDFYVVPSRQRSGLGRSLFDYMLHDTELSPIDLAIDGPSTKMERFLAKNYGIEHLMRQNNNFAVSPRFFDKLSTDPGNKSGRSTPAVAAAYGRFAAPKPPSAIATVIHGGASYFAEAGASNNGDTSERAGASSERAGDVSEGAEAAVAAPERAVDSPNRDISTPPSADECLPEPRVWLPVHRCDTPPYWDSDYEAEVAAKLAREKEEDDDEKQRREQAAGEGPERPSTLPVESEAAAPPAAPAPFADVPAAGLPSGASTPASASGAGAGGRRDSQLTDKGYFDVKFYHNRLW